MFRSVTEITFGTTMLVETASTSFKERPFIRNGHAFMRHYGTGLEIPLFWADSFLSSDLNGATRPISCWPSCVTSAPGKSDRRYQASTLGTTNRSSYVTLRRSKDAL
jgi:hypothetical protein